MLTLIRALIGTLSYLILYFILHCVVRTQDGP